MTQQRMWAFLVCISASLSLLAIQSMAQSSPPTDFGVPIWSSYPQIATIPIPGGGPASFDISWVDSFHQTYFIADRTSGAGGRIDVIDAAHDTFLFSVDGFVGTVKGAVSGPNGLVVIPNSDNAFLCSGDEAWAGDGVPIGGVSSVKVVDLSLQQVVASISTGPTASCPTCMGKSRADELAWDSEDNTIVIANDNDVPPYLTFIDVPTRTVLGQLPFPNATAGLEQSLWDEQDHTFYISVPATTANPGGEIDAVSPKTMTAKTVVVLPSCSPAGLALGPEDHLLVGCGSTATYVVAPTAGSIVATIPQVTGEDEVWFNPGDNHYYTASDHNPSGFAIGVIDAITNQWIENIPIPVSGAHSVAVNSMNNRIFVPETNKGIAVFTHGGPVAPTPLPPPVGE